MHCSTCGSANRKGADYCVQCGSKLNPTDNTYSPKANFLALRIIAFVIGTLGISMILGSLILIGFMFMDTEIAYPAPLAAPVVAPLVAIAGIIVLAFAEMILLFVNIEDQTFQILHWVKKSQNDNHLGSK